MSREYKPCHNDEEKSKIRVKIEGKIREVVEDRVNNGDQRTKTRNEGIHRHFDRRKKNFDERKPRLNDGESNGLIDKRRHFYNNTFY